MKNTVLFLAFFFFIQGGILQAQKIELQKIEPAFWWADMKNKNLQRYCYRLDIKYTLGNFLWRPKWSW